MTDEQPKATPSNNGVVTTDPADDFNFDAPLSPELEAMLADIASDGFESDPEAVRLYDEQVDRELAADGIEVNTPDRTASILARIDRHETRMAETAAASMSAEQFNLSHAR
ncbi:hypothetical protein ACC685_33555 [Rhizobium ruizarguesonis]